MNAKVKPIQWISNDTDSTDDQDCLEWSVSRMDFVGETEEGSLLITYNEEDRISPAILAIPGASPTLLQKVKDFVNLDELEEYNSSLDFARNLVFFLNK